MEQRQLGVVATTHGKPPRVDPESIARAQWHYNTAFFSTLLERTLIDIAVRPHYSGGVAGVLAAYRKAGRRVSVRRITRYLDVISFSYPYHQPIGYYLEEAGGFTDRDLKPLRAKQREFDFYLAHGMKKTGYSQRWRIYYLKETPR